MSNQAGKGDSPRNCLSSQFKSNYDLIEWGKDKKNINKHKKTYVTRNKNTQRPDKSV